MGIYEQAIWNATRRASMWRVRAGLLLVACGCCGIGFGILAAPRALTGEGGAAGAAGGVERPHPAEETLVDGINAFGLDLFARLRTEAKGNLVFSAYSMHEALAMTGQGAHGATRAQMSKALHFDMVPPSGMREGAKSQAVYAYPSLRVALRGARPKDPYTLAIANRLWGMQGHLFKPDFLAAVRTRFGAELGRLDYKANPDAARGVINRWVEEQTNDMIQNLLGPGTVTADTKLILTNAIYFLGDWESPFKKTGTGPAPFHLDAATERTVSMMHQAAFVPYAETDTLKAIAMGYRGGQYEMVLVLPKRRFGLAAVEAALTPATLTELHAALARERKETRIVLPKVAMEFGGDMIPHLQALGMRDAFQFGKADFSGMDGTKDLYIGGVIHKARIIMDEKGTEAAAATAVVMPTGMAPQPEEPKVFRADEPYLFWIRHRETGAILFMGRVATPDKHDPDAEAARAPAARPGADAAPGAEPDPTPATAEPAPPPSDPTGGHGREPTVAPGQVPGRAPRSKR